MKKVRCAICRQHLPSLRILKNHYINNHSKTTVVKKLLKLSVFSSTPSALRRRVKREKNEGSAPVVVKEDSGNESLLENCENESPREEKNVEEDVVVVTRRSERIKKRRQNLELAEKEKSSQHVSSDTESCSDTSKSLFCASCGNGYNTIDELLEHEKSHQFQCRICNQIFNVNYYKEHIEQHVIKVYVCHVCGFEFICKDTLSGHLNYHNEQQTIENVLSMEQDYSMCGFGNAVFLNGDYYSNIGNIVRFLSYPYDYYNRNIYMKIICDVCYQEFYVYEYERHMKVAHLSFS